MFSRPPTFCDSDDPAALRRGRRLLLTENAFATALGAALSGPFLTALVLAMGGGPLELSIVMASAYVGSLGMLITNHTLNRLGSRRRVCLVDLGVVRSLRIVIAAMPLLVYMGFGQKSLIWPVVVSICLSTFFGWSAEVSRRSWISDLVRPEDRGRFFSHRVIIGSSMNVAVLLAGGLVLDYFKNIDGGRHTLLGPPIIVGFGFFMGVVSWILIFKTPEPQMTRPRREPDMLESLQLPWRHPRFRPLIVSAACWGLAMGLAVDFFTLYMKQDLQMQWTWIAVVTMLGELAAIACAPLFGRWADRSGARRVLAAFMLVQAVYPLLWLVVLPATWPLLLGITLLNAVGSGGQIAWLRLSLNLAPQRNQPAYLAMHYTMQSLGTGVGVVIGGQLAAHLSSHDLGSLAGFKIVPLHVLFILSAGLRLASMSLVRFVREPSRIMAALGARREEELKAQS